MPELIQIYFQLYRLSDSPQAWLFLMLKLTLAIFVSWLLPRSLLYVLGKSRLGQWAPWPRWEQGLSLLFLVASAAFWLWMLLIVYQLYATGQLFKGLFR